MPIFKYLPRQYADALLVMGTIRIGTLYDFRKMEHAQGVADPSEGTKSVLARPDREIVTDDPAEKDAFLRMMGAKVFGKISVPRGMRFLHKQTSPDYFLFCASTELSNRVQAEFESTDACVEIKDINAFLGQLTQALNAVVPVRFNGVHAVQYTERTQEQSLTRFRDFNPAHGFHPALIKEPSFRRQKEVRAIWSPVSTTLPEPIIISSLRLSEYCSDVSAHIKL